MTGYKYNTEQEAQAAVAQCDTHYGYPKAGAVTEHWVDYQEASLNTPIFWYIKHDDSLNVVLGEPMEFEVIYPNPFENA